jgi:hypothetical protein
MGMSGSISAQAHSVKDIKAVVYSGSSSSKQAEGPSDGASVVRLPQYPWGLFLTALTPSPRASPKGFILDPLKYNFFKQKYLSCLASKNKLAQYPFSD